MKYLVTQIVRVQYGIVVDAANEEEAIEAADSTDLEQWREDYFDTIRYEVVERP